MKKVLITGTGRGIGWKTAEKFLSQGYFVIGTSTSGQSLILNENFENYQLQLTSEISINFAVEQIFTKHPQIDLFISNAGFAEEEKGSIDIALLRKSLEVNLIGTADFAQKTVDHVTAQGRIVFIGSTMGSVSRLDGSDYASYRISKAALHMYSRILAKNLESREIKVITMHPGWVKTDMGGIDAPKTAEKAAEDIFFLATKAEVPTGTFWDETTQAEW